MSPLSLGAHTFGFVWNDDVEAALETIGAAGFRHVQIMASPPHFDPWADDPARTRRIQRLLERHRLDLLAIDLASSDINLASPSQDVVNFAVDAYARCIRHCAELGARWICVGSGRRHALLDRANTRLMEAFRPGFARIHAIARKAGIGVVLENHPQGLLADAAGIDAFLRAEGYDDIPVIYDVTNGFAIGEDPVEGIRLLRDRIAILHVSDSPAGQWRHDPIGSGAVDFAAIGRLVQSAPFSGAVVLEILSAQPLQGLVQGRQRLEAAGWRFA